MKKLKKISLSGAHVWPIIEGGKGINGSNGFSSGAFAAAGAVGTISGTLPVRYGPSGKMEPIVCEGTTRLQRHLSLIEKAAQNGVHHIKLAYEIAAGKGRIHINYLWEAGGTKKILGKVLEQTKGLLHGVTAGAGMPFDMAPMASAVGVFYYPIVSSLRAFQLLWKRSYQNYVEHLGGVVYEDPWHAGGHNGLSNQEDPLKPQRPMERIVALRRFMTDVGVHVPIIIAGKVWRLDEWQDYMDNDDLGAVAFQFGTRPLLTKESPLPASWKNYMRTVKPADLVMHRLSPTGFWSSAVRNTFLKGLLAIGDRQLAVRKKEDETFCAPLAIGARKRLFFFQPEDKATAEGWIKDGFDTGLLTPSETMVFVNDLEADRIRTDQAACVGCLSRCRFSSWAEREENHTTGLLPDPRSFCIQKSLTEATLGHNLDKALLFSGSQGWRFSQDPLFAEGAEPTVGELVKTILDNQ